MRDYAALTIFEIKRQTKSLIFILTFLLSLIVLVSSQLHYIVNYQLNSVDEYEYVRAKKSIDIEIPLTEEEQVVHFIEMINHSVSSIEISDGEREQFLIELESIIRSKDAWAMSELDSIQDELTSQHGWLEIFGPSKILSGAYKYSWTKPATYPELKEYIARTNQSFLTFFSREYAQEASLLFSVAFICFFSFLLQRESRSYSKELLFSKPISPRVIFLSKISGAFVLCLLTMLVVSATITVLLAVFGVAVGITGIFTILVQLCYYAIPTLIFFMGLAVLVSIATKSGFAVLPVFFIMMILSSLTQTTAEGRATQNLFTTPILMEHSSFYFPTSSERFFYESLNRIAFLIIGLVMLWCAQLVWSKVTTGSSKNLPKHQAIRASQAPEVLNPTMTLPSKKVSFVFENIKICLSPLFLAFAGILLIMPFIISPAVAVTEIGDKILANTGWAAIALYANIFAVEFFHSSFDTLAVTRRKLSCVFSIRLIIASGTMFILVSLVFLIALLQYGDISVPILALTSYLQTIVACMTCILFFGLVSTIFSNLLQNGWVGLLCALPLNIIFISFADVESIFNIYAFKVHYSTSDSYLWLKSAGFYIAMVVILYFVNRAIIENGAGIRLRFLSVKKLIEKLKTYGRV